LVRAGPPHLIVGLKTAEDLPVVDERPVVIDCDVGDADALRDQRVLAHAREIQHRRLCPGWRLCGEEPESDHRGDGGISMHGSSWRYQRIRPVGSSTITASYLSSIGISTPSSSSFQSVPS